MKTNGVVGGATLALSLCLFAHNVSAQEFQLRGFFRDNVVLPVADAVEETVYATDEFADTTTTQLQSYIEGCCACCGCDCYDPHWYGGTEFSFLGVNNRTGGSITLSVSDTTAPSVSTASILDGGGIVTFAYAPRLWLGRQWNENWGVRATYFSLAANETRLPMSNPAIPPTGQNFTTFLYQAYTSMSAVDVDLVRSLQPTDDWKLDILVGARYARLAVNSDSIAYGVFTTGHFLNIAQGNSCEMEGVGPTVGFQSRHRIHDSNLYFFVGGRGSYCYGYSDSSARTSAVIVASGLPSAQGSATVSRNDYPLSYLGILETQMGFQYDFQLFNLPVNAFVRTSVDWQYWRIDGPPTGGVGFSNSVNEMTVNSLTRAGLGSANLVGLSFATGFTW